MNSISTVVLTPPTRSRATKCLIFIAIALSALPVTYARAQDITRIEITSYTGKDDKDRGDSVTVVLISGNEVVVEYGPAHDGLVFRDHSTNTWELQGMKRPFKLSECPQSRLIVTKSGDKGWYSSFEAYGFTSDGKNKYQLLKRTDVRLFGNRAELFSKLSGSGIEIRRSSLQGERGYEYKLTCQ